MAKLGLLAFLVAIVTCTTTNPGVKVRITKHGLAFANQVAHEEIVKNLQTLTIPDQSGQDGSISYSLTHIRVQGVTPPVSSINLVPAENGVTWALTNFGISLTADWSVSYRKSFIHISDSGSLDVSLSGVNVAETAHFGVDSTGRPSISSNGCSDSIAGVDVHFHGGTAFILNLFRHIVEDKIKEALQPKICEEVETVINVNAENILAGIDITTELADSFLLDYRLVAAPLITSDYLEIWDKGELYWNANQTESPFVPQTIPEWHDNSRMVYIWVTSYSPNTFLYQAHTHNFLKYNVTKKDLPPDYADYLNTTCSLKCIGTLIPQIGKQFPNSSVELRIKTSSAPRLSAAPSAVHTNATSIVELWARAPDNKQTYLLTLGMNLTLTLNASLQSEKLSGKIAAHTFKLTVLKSAIGTLSQPLLNIVIGGVLDIVVIPQLNKIAAKGVVLPMVQGVEFTNTQLFMQQGDILIGTDLKYKVAQSAPGTDLLFQSEKGTAMAGGMGY